MRKPGKPTYNFYARIDGDTDQRRRRLQDLLDCSAGELVHQAFRKFEAQLASDRRPGASEPAG
jgi:hypothetical protein